MAYGSEIAPDKPGLQPKPLDFPVVAIGASAGGLAAFEAFLRNVDPTVEAAYVLVQHLDPEHESILPELLARGTPMPVVQIEDGTRLEPGSVYVIPAGHALAVEDGVLSLVEFDKPRGFRRPIDDFFQALAIDQGPNAAAVVLTGTGGDGTVGVRHVKEAGGLAVVQDPAEATYDGMPASAIGTGLVDFVLPLSEMPATIARYFAARVRNEDAEGFDRDDVLARIMDAVRHHTGHDFSYYKVNTIIRRVQRRMQVLDLVEPARYAEVVGDRPAEAEALFQDLLINVTAFFRDPEVFDVLRRAVIPEIVRAAGFERPIRIWIPGCSSGEEAYSMAILVAEATARLDRRPEVQIFATDIDEEMLARARAGLYMQSDVADLPPELLQRYFTVTDEGYLVSPAIRDMVRVSAHSVIKDPPFSRMDLISCRNLLIYFDAELQSRVLPLFHYAMRADGWLVLGSAENVAGRSDLFEAVAREERVYRKIPKLHSQFVLPLPSRGQGGRSIAGARAKARAHEREDRDARMTRRILERYAPPHLVVDGQGRLVHVSPRIGPFLALSLDQASRRLLDLAPSELRPALRSMLTALAKRRRRIVRRGVEMTADDDDILTVDLVAEPLDGDEAMIVFRETGRRPADDDDDPDADVGEFRAEERVHELEDELAETRATLRTTVEELETSNEELRSSNEEMMSMNEELQSANEELSTVNEELKAKLDELARLNADQVNFLESTRIATVFVDRDMRVRAFTPVARRLFRFKERDKGRPLLDVRTAVPLDMLRGAMGRALDGKEGLSEALAVGGETYTFRALPYRGHEGRIDGAVLVFDDVTQLVAAQGAAVEMERAVAASRREIELLYENAPLGIALIDRERRYRRINGSLAAYNGPSVEDHLGRTISDVLPVIGPKLDAVIDEVFATGRGVARWELVAPAPQDPSKGETFELDIYPVANDDTGEVESVGVIVHRVTEARRLEADLRHLMAELQHRVKNSLATVLAIVGQTVRATADREALATAITSRVRALAATHNLLTRGDWRAVTIRDLVDEELAPYGDDTRIAIAGPPVELGSKAALTFALVIHELATNAAKYGALSEAVGRLDIRWAVQDGRLAFDWIEGLGRPVERPERSGFGLKFIERSVRHDLDGRTTLDWEGQGLACHVEAAVSRVVAGPSHG